MSHAGGVIPRHGDYDIPVCLDRLTESLLLNQLSSCHRELKHPRRLHMCGEDIARGQPSVSDSLHGPWSQQVALLQTCDGHGSGKQLLLAPSRLV